MKKWIKKLRKIKFFDFCFSIYFRYEEIWNYLIVGGLTTVFNVLFYFVLAKIFHIDYMTSTVIDWIVTVALAFWLNKVFVFKSKKQGKEFAKETFEFFKYRIITLLIEIAFMYFFVDLFSMPDVIAKIIVNIIVIVLNYIFSKIFIFKR